MNVTVKKYLWLLPFVFVGICAWFAGGTAAHWVEQTWLMGDDNQPPPPRRFNGPTEKTRSKDTEAIVERNIFCARCERKKEEAAEESGPQSHDPKRSELPLELVSTMVVPADERWSMAVIRETASKEKDAGMFKTNSILPGGARVVRVIEKKVYLLNGNRLEFLDIEGAAGPAAGVASGDSIARVEMDTGNRDPLDGDVDRGVRCTGARCEIDRSLVDKLLQNTTMLATAARFVPSIKDGRPNGFKLYAIRPSSIFGKIGLQNGDTVKTINGMDMSTPDQALGVYTKVRSASHLTVGVERRGETVTLDYTIR